MVETTAVISFASVSMRFKDQVWVSYDLWRWSIVFTKGVISMLGSEWLINDLWKADIAIANYNIVSIFFGRTPLTVRCN